MIGYQQDRFLFVDPFNRVGHTVGLTITDYLHKPTYKRNAKRSLYRLT